MKQFAEASLRTAKLEDGGHLFLPMFTARGTELSFCIKGRSKIEKK